MSNYTIGYLSPFVLLAGLVYTYRDYVLLAFEVAFTLVFVLLTIKGFRRLRMRHIQRSLRAMDVDSMDGLAFEQYVAGLLVNKGYTNVSLTEQYDYGVDIVAEKDGVRWGIQVKRYSGLVKAEAVRQVVTGLALYDCDRAMVITNSTFSNVAQRLAAGNDCVLVDRRGLYGLAI